MLLQPPFSLRRLWEIALEIASALAHTRVRNQARRCARAFWVMAVLHTLPHVISQVISKLAASGPAGQAGYVAGLSFWTILCLPTTPLEITSGFVWPVGTSVGMSVLGKTLGSVAALCIGRRLLRPAIHRLAGGRVGGRLRRHVLHELRLRPVQTMGLLRACPLPSPLKIYGLCLLPDQLVPLSTFSGVVLGINTAWSIVWSVTGSSGSSLHEALAGGGAGSPSSAALAKLIGVATLGAALLALSRYAKAQLTPPPADEADAGRSPPCSPPRAAERRRAATRAAHGQGG